MIVDAQKNYTKLQEMVQLVGIGDKIDYAIDESGGLLYKSRLCVPNDMDLRNKILYESPILFSPCTLEVIKCTKI